MTDQQRIDEQLNTLEAVLDVFVNPPNHISAEDQHWHLGDLVEAIQVMKKAVSNGELL